MTTGRQKLHILATKSALTAAERSGDPLRVRATATRHVAAIKATHWNTLRTDAHFEASANALAAPQGGTADLTSTDRHSR